MVLVGISLVVLLAFACVMAKFIKTVKLIEEQRPIDPKHPLRRRAGKLCLAMELFLLAFVLAAAWELCGTPFARGAERADLCIRIIVGAIIGCTSLVGGALAFFTHIGAESACTGGD